MNPNGFRSGFLFGKTKTQDDSLALGFVVNELKYWGCVYSNKGERSHL
jgi:hypothetical protein